MLPRPAIDADLAASAQLYRAVQLAGACYLVLLGIRGWRATARSGPAGASALTTRRTSRFTTQTAREIGARVGSPGVLADGLQHAGQAAFLRGLLGAR